MVKLYKNNNNVFHYWEYWETDTDEFIIHWGKVGERGEDKTANGNTVVTEMRLQVENGYAEIDEEDIATLIIEYAIDGMGKNTDLDKRYAVQARMDETLGWTGLGHCDGGSIGSGSMEVCCMVVDFAVAKRVIEDDLSNTEFKDYASIYLEE